jgi:hypothetical protein
MQLSPSCGDLFLEHLAEPEILERQRTQARNQVMHRGIQPRRGVADQLRGFARLLVLAAEAMHQGQRQAANRGDALSGLVVQFARDVPAFFLDAILHRQCEFAALLEADVCFERFATRAEVVFDRLRHLVERACDRGRFGIREYRQARVVGAALHRIQALLDQLERPRRAPHEPEHEQVAEHDDHNAEFEHAHGVVPAIEDGARGIGFDDQVASREAKFAADWRGARPPAHARVATGS